MKANVQTLFLIEGHNLVCISHDDRILHMTVSILFKIDLNLPINKHYGE